eukprot:TRINITY_DN32619_c0_g1_i1.p1 TRINITY_DN32619_c0_g1~~TRINITY_DN32619_c0_g1_i1.p1  ORF type:complete len:240 (+),score=48.57 TRINITY_DN32619_c0_g1_i1:135-854(+)
MAIRVTRILSAVKPPSLHGSHGQQISGSYTASLNLVGQVIGGVKSQIAEHGLSETVFRFLRHKDVRYFLPHIEKVGEDEFGNQYFIDNGTATNPQMKTRQRRVIYGGAGNTELMDYPFEANAISPVWYAWLHHMDDRIPEAGEKLSPGAAKFVELGSGMSGQITDEPYKHVSQYRPNQTQYQPTMDSEGTAYYQPGHRRGGNHRIQTYEAWNGESNSKTHIKTHGGIPVANVNGDSSQL